MALPQIDPDQVGLEREIAELEAELERLPRVHRPSYEVKVRRERVTFHLERLRGMRADPPARCLTCDGRGTLSSGGTCPVCRGQGSYVKDNPERDDWPEGF